jgi:hypothetical protein
MRINDELVTRCSSSQTCPYMHQTAAQPDFCATKFKPVRKSSNCCSNSQTTPHMIKLFAQQPVLRKLFDRVWCSLYIASDPHSLKHFCTCCQILAHSIIFYISGFRTILALFVAM